METNSLARVNLRGPEVHVYKEGRLYYKPFFLAGKRACCVNLRGTTLSLTEKKCNESRVFCIRKAHLSVHEATKAIAIRTESGDRLCFYAENEKEFKDWVEAIADSIYWKVQRFYEIREDLGKGSFATVKKGICKESNELVAIKIIQKSTCNAEDMKYLQREIDLTQRLRHRNIVRTSDLFESESKLYMVFEHVGGGTLEAFQARNGPLVEPQVRSVMRDILTGVAYIHKNSIAHRDIKPENMLCTSKHFPTTVKLMDFGLARSLKPNMTRSSGGPRWDDALGPCELMTTPVGTPSFVAPEVLTCLPYGREADLFACGVVLYWLLCGYLPFRHEDIQQLIQLIKRTKFHFPEADWEHVSDDAKNLISGLLNRSPYDRLTALEALQHPWFVQIQGKARTSAQDHLQDDNTTDEGTAFEDIEQPYVFETDQLLQKLSPTSRDGD